MQIMPLSSGSHGNAYHITSGDSSLLIECGIPFKKIQQGIDFKVSALDGCLISHAHGDHAKAASDLAKAGVDVIATKETLDAIGLTGHRAHAIKALWFIGDWRVRAFDVVHDCLGAVGFLVQHEKTQETLLYLTDTMYSPYHFNEMPIGFGPIDYLMIECNYSLDIIRENVASGEIDQARKNLQAMK